MYYKNHNEYIAHIMGNDKPLTKLVEKEIPKKKETQKKKKEVTKK